MGRHVGSPTSCFLFNRSFPISILGIKHAPWVILLLASAVSAQSAENLPATTATPRQSQWLQSSPAGRILLAERLGEEGAEAYAAKKGYAPILRNGDKTLRQGFDQVYRAKDGGIVVIEAKGGTSAINRAYGCEQGTPEWAVQAAKRTSESAKASAAEKQAARLVLEAAKDGTLTVQVVRTPHVLGEPRAAVVESTLRAGQTESKIAAAILEELTSGARALQPSSQASKTAAAAAVLPAKPEVVSGEAEYVKQLSELAAVEEKQIKDALVEASEHIRTEGNSRWVKVGGKWLKFVGKAAGPAGVVITAFIYANEAGDIEQSFERGELTREQADAKQAALAVRTTATIGGGIGGLAAGASIGTFICPGPGTVIGGVVGAVAGFVGMDIVMAATGLSDAVGEFLQPGVEAVRRACSYVKDKGIAVKIAVRDKLREWVGAETFDQVAAALDDAGSWTIIKAKQAAVAVKDSAVFVKDKAVEGAIVVGDAAVDGAKWTARQATGAYRFLRRQFD